jgi:hypothetical protein
MKDQMMKVPLFNPEDPPVIISSAVTTTEKRGCAKANIFSVALCLVGLVNAFFLARLVHEVKQIVPAAKFVIKYQNEVGSVLDALSAGGNAAVRLFHGSIPVLVNEFFTSDISGAAKLADIFANEVHEATCIPSSDEANYLNSAIYYISSYASLVQSVAQEIALIPGLKPTDDGPNPNAEDDDVGQLTGRGGTLFQPLVYFIGFVKSQTCPEQWKTTSCSCSELVGQLQSNVAFKGEYGAECSASSNSWDVQSKAFSYLNDLYITCSYLCESL